MKYYRYLKDAAALFAAAFILSQPATAASAPAASAADPSVLFDRKADARAAKASFAALRDANRSYLLLLETKQQDLAKAELDYAAAWAALNSHSASGQTEGGGQAEDGSVFLGTAEARRAFDEARARASALAAEIAGRQSGAAAAAAGQSRLVTSLSALKTKGRALSSLFRSVPVKYLTLNSSAYGRVESGLLALSPDLEALFPEVPALGRMLKASGREGKRLWLALLCSGDSEEIAGAIISSKNEILTILPKSSAELADLAAAYNAEQLLSAAGADLLFPDRNRDNPDRTGLAAAAGALHALDQKRGRALLSALSSGTLPESVHRLPGTGSALERFALLASALGPVRQAGFVSDRGLSPEAFARLAECLPVVPGMAHEPSAAEKQTALPASAPDVAQTVLALNTIFATIDKSEALGESSARDCLAFLEKPELAVFAASNKRYTEPYTKARAVLDAAFGKAEGSAVQELEKDARVQKLASVARRTGKKGGSPKVLVFKSASAGASARSCIAFALETPGGSGKTILIPLPASVCGPIYAAAFASALGPSPGPASTEKPEALLARCGILVLDALPRGGGLAVLAAGCYPAALDIRGAAERLAAIEAELMLEAE